MMVQKKKIQIKLDLSADDLDETRDKSPERPIFRTLKFSPIQNVLEVYFPVQSVQRT